MKTTIVNLTLLAALAAVWFAPPVSAQTSEIERLRREYDQQLRVMQQAFEERLSALEEEVEGRPNNLQWYWKEGLRFEAANGDFKFKLSGRIQWDNAFYDADSDIETAYATEFEDGSEFRRVRLALSGTIYEDFEFKTQYDFTDGDVDFKDVYVGVNTDFGTLRAGHFKEAISLENLTSSKDVTFMERALPNAFMPGRSAGIGYFNAFANDTITVAAGIFRDADDFGDADDDEDEISITGRVTARPWVNEEGSRYIHLGAGASYREGDEDDSTFRFRERPESHLSPVRLVDTGTVTGWEDTQLYVLEAAVVLGPFHAQSEYVKADLSTDSTISGLSGDPDFDGWYIQAGYFLTGEHRRYKAGDGKFDKVRPTNNFRLDGSGLGAWEVAARYSMIDLDDKVDGGEQDDFTLGLNWYLNPNMRLALNYVHANIDDRTVGGVNVDDDVDVVQTRFQVTW